MRELFLNKMLQKL